MPTIIFPIMSPQIKYVFCVFQRFLKIKIQVIELVQFLAEHHFSISTRKERRRKARRTSKERATSSRLARGLEYKRKTPGKNQR